jgi:hypothetical protein
MDEINLILSKFDADFGRRLTSIETGLALRTEEQVKTLLRSTPNLKTFDSEIYWEPVNDPFSLNLKGFKSIWANHLNSFKLSANKYCKQLVMFKVCLHFEEDLMNNALIL